MVIEAPQACPAKCASSLREGRVAGCRLIPRWRRRYRTAALAKPVPPSGRYAVTEFP